MKYIDFFRESIKNIKTVGTFTRSSKFLCKRMVMKADLTESKAVVELGAGDGVLTRFILRSLPEDARLIVFEVNENFCKQLNNINDPRLKVVCDSAEKLAEVLDEEGIEELDYVFSAIPFVVIPDPVARKIIETCRERLANDGTYLQIHYTLLSKQLYSDIFGNVSVSFIPLNLPPAFILQSQKLANGMPAKAS